MTADLNVITPGIPAMDGCPVLTRIKAFICQEGVNVTLEQTFRDRTGNPVDLFTPAEVSESGSIDFSDSDNDDDRTRPCQRLGGRHRGGRRQADRGGQR